MTYKYFGLIGLGGFIITHTHPDVMVTVGPPLILGGYWAYTRYQRYLYCRETAKIAGTIPKGIKKTKDPVVIPSGSIRILPYDEALLSNVLLSLENQFDHFKYQIVDLVERRIVDHVVSSRAKGEIASLTQLFIDENDQFNVNISENDVETFILLRVGKANDEAIGGTNDDSCEIPFIKMSLPFYTDSLLRKRLGVIEVYLLEHPAEEPYTEYSMGIEISPYKWMSTEKLVIGGEGIMKSRLLETEEKKEEKEEKLKEYEEFTINV